MNQLKFITMRRKKLYVRTVSADDRYNKKKARNQKKPD